MFAGRRASRNAISSGTAVSASATLCSVSPSSATDPEMTTTIACTAGGGQQAGQADQQRPATGRVGFQRVIDLIGRIVGVPAEQLA